LPRSSQNRPGTRTNPLSQWPERAKKAKPSSITKPINIIKIIKQIKTNKTYKSNKNNLRLISAPLNIAEKFLRPAGKKKQSFRPKARKAKQNKH
jgi:hypothetical protein